MKGNKGNKHAKGRPPVTEETMEVKALARTYTKAAMDKLAYLMDHAESEETQARCAERLLCRGWGNPEQPTPVTHDLSMAPGSAVQVFAEIYRNLPRTVGIPKTKM